MNLQALVAGTQPESELFRLMANSVRDYAIFLLDPSGKIASWNSGARLIKQYEPDEIIGRHFSVFYTDQDNNKGWPEHELALARETGRFEDEGWRVRKDGSQFWANVIITPLRDDEGKVLAYSKITRDLTERKRNEENLRQSRRCPGLCDLSA
jgi:PAS domain S-box-containing protein